MSTIDGDHSEIDHDGDNMSENDNSGDYADDEEAPLEDDEWEEGHDQYIDDDYSDQEDVDGGDEEQQQQQEPPELPEIQPNEQIEQQPQGMQLRRGPRENRTFTDYKVLGTRGRDLTAMNPAFDKDGNLMLSTHEFGSVTTTTNSSKLARLRRLTDQSRVLENRETASSHNTHRFTSAQRPHHD